MIKLVKTGSCTLGIPAETIREHNGLLRFLLDKNVNELEWLELNASDFTPTAGQNAFNTNFGRVRIRIYRDYTLKKMIPNLKELIDDLQIHGFSGDHQVKTVDFRDPINKKHVYTLTRPSSDTYRVSRIDGKNVNQPFISFYVPCQYPFSLAIYKRVTKIADLSRIKP